MNFTEQYKIWESLTYNQNLNLVAEAIRQAVLRCRNLEGALEHAEEMREANYDRVLELEAQLAEKDQTIKALKDLFEAIADALNKNLQENATKSGY